MTTATEWEQQQLIDILAEKPRTFNYDIPVYRTQCVTINHKLTARELKSWAEEQGYCKDTAQIPTADDWEQWNQHYLDYLEHGDAWAEVDEWSEVPWKNEDYSNWNMDGEIDAWSNKEGE